MGAHGEWASPSGTGGWEAGSMRAVPEPSGAGDSGEARETVAAGGSEEPSSRPKALKRRPELKIGWIDGQKVAGEQALF